MNFIPPKVCDSFFDLYGGGRVYFGRASFGSGQRVGTAPIVARIEVPKSNGFIPSDWFVVRSFNSMHKINKEIEKTKTADGLVFIPDWLRADCFEWHYNAVRNT
tara:strand:+ start:450 stop:761 length:312 start_codon:yes stop_codon:yes gene_type:complete